MPLPSATQDRGADKNSHPRRCAAQTWHVFARASSASLLQSANMLCRQIANVVERLCAVSPGDLRKSIHVGSKSGSSGELVARSLDTEKSPRTRADFVVAALNPTALLRRGIPIPQQ